MVSTKLLRWHLLAISITLTTLLAVSSLWVEDGLLPFGSAITDARAPVTLSLWKAFLLFFGYTPSFTRLLTEAAITRGASGVAAAGVCLLALVGVFFATSCAGGTRCDVDDHGVVVLAMEVQTTGSILILLGTVSFFWGALPNQRNRRIALFVLALVFLLRLLTTSPWSLDVRVAVYALELGLVVFVHACLYLSARTAALRVKDPRLERVGPKALELAVVLLLAPLVASAVGPMLIITKRMVHLGEHENGVVKPVENWAGLPLSPHAHRHFRPTSREQLVELVQSASSVRVVGAGHSWSSLSAPRRDGIVIQTSELRGIETIDATHVRAEAGVNFASLNRHLHVHNLMLLSNYWGAVSVSGSLSTCVQHTGRSFFHDHVTSVDLVLHNGSMRTLTSADSAFAFLCGSVGQLGVIANVTLEAVPRRKWSWHTQRRTYQSSIVQNWVDNNTRRSILWVLPRSKRAIVHTAHIGSVDLSDADVDRSETMSLFEPTPFADVGLTSQVYATLVASAWALARPLVALVARDVTQSEALRFVDEYTTQELSLPHLPSTGIPEERETAMLGTLEIEIVVHTSMLVSCIDSLVNTLPFEIPIHARWVADVAAADAPLVTVGSDLVRLDLSIPESLAQSTDASKLQRACPKAGNPHPGKNDLNDLQERRLWRRAPTSRPPPGWDDEAFQALRAQHDPYGKFTPLYKST